MTSRHQTTTTLPSPSTWRSCTTSKPFRRAVVAAALTASALLSGCSMQWASMSQPVLEARTAPSPASSRPAPTATTPAATARPAAAKELATAPAACGDLEHGAAKRELALGARSLLMHYWTSGSDPDVVQVSATVRGDRKHAVKATRFAASLATTKAGGLTETHQLIDDRGEFVMTPPFSYTTAIEVPGSSPGAAAGQQPAERTLSIRLDLLIETEPGSGAYFRQSVIDDVRVACDSRGVK